LGFIIAENQCVFPQRMADGSIRIGFLMPDNPNAVPPPIEYLTRCRLIRKVADGGMGTVYLAEQYGDSGFAKTVALKVIRRDRLDDPASTASFVAEAKLVADLVHPNILQVYNLGVAAGQCFIVMEYLHGVTLSQFIQRHQKKSAAVPEPWALYIVSRVCRALAYAHAKRDRQGRLLGIVHRDVAPSNIMLSMTGEIKLADFGVAQTMFADSVKNPRVQAGRLAFMSPEQLRAQIIDARSDLYSTGLVLLETLTGSRFFRDKTLEERRAFHQAGRSPDVRAQRPGTSDDLAALIDKSLKNDPDDRFTSAADMDKAIQSCLHRAIADADERPSAGRLASHLARMFPEIDRNRIE
jgi:eukaryotic-like serine/threonine-protein kinase